MSVPACQLVQLVIIQPRDTSACIKQASSKVLAVQALQHILRHIDRVCTISARLVSMSPPSISVNQCPSPLVFTSSVLRQLYI